MTTVELLTFSLIVGCMLLLICYTSKPRDGFGRNNRPFEPDNSMMMRNPWDEIDYIVPSVKMFVDE